MRSKVIVVSFFSIFTESPCREMHVSSPAISRSREFNGLTASGRREHTLAWSTALQYTSATVHCTTAAIEPETGCIHSKCNKSHEHVL